MKILIVKTSALGDIIHAFPALQYLRNHFPDAQIDWVVEHAFAPLVESHPALNNVLKVNTKKWRKGFWKPEVIQEINHFRRQLRQTSYDMLFDLQANMKSGLINSLVKSPKKYGFASATVHEWPNLIFTNQRCNPPKGKNIRDDYLYIAQNAVGDFNSEIQGVKLKIQPTEQAKIKEILQHPNLQGNHPRIMVCPGSNWPNKQLGKENLLEFLKLIEENLQGRFVFVWGMKEEKQLAEDLAEQFPGKAYIADKMPLPTLQNLMAELDLVFAMDSLPLHLAATTPTPTYSVFGASSANKYKPTGKLHEAFQGTCPYGKTFEKRCPILRTCSSGSCIKDVQGNALFEHFINWWNSLYRT